ncbi:hypothetical protein SCA04_10170 [Staphylococcus carnosus]|nr:hypothetical protein SCA04_10170 [Staphylococcus carnosus]
MKWIYDIIVRNHEHCKDLPCGLKYRKSRLKRAIARGELEVFKGKVSKIVIIVMLVAVIVALILSSLAPLMQ